MGHLGVSSFPEVGTSITVYCPPKPTSFLTLSGLLFPSYLHLSGYIRDLCPLKLQTEPFTPCSAIVLTCKQNSSNLKGQGLHWFVSLHQLFCAVNLLFPIADARRNSLPGGSLKSLELGKSKHFRRALSIPHPCTVP